LNLRYQTPPFLSTSRRCLPTSVCNSHIYYFYDIHPSEDKILGRMSRTFRKDEPPFQSGAAQTTVR